MFDLEAAKTAVANAEMKLLSAELEVLSSGDSPAPQFPRTAQNTIVKMCFAKHVLQDVHIKRTSRKYCLNVIPNFRRQIPSEFQWNVVHLTLTNPVRSHGFKADESVTKQARRI